MDEIRKSVDARQLAELRRQYLGRLLQRAYRASADLAAQKLNERGHTGLSLATTVALTHLDLEGTRISVLAERAGMTKQSMGQVVAELESLGYVTRSPDSTDRRATRVQFTETGWRFLLDAAAVKQEIEAEYAALLGVEELDTLRALLEKLLS
jgi:DNA-binding MarR family transcriptional regulator